MVVTRRLHDGSVPLQVTSPIVKVSGEAAKSAAEYAEKNDLGWKSRAILELVRVTYGYMAATWRLHTGWKSRAILELVRPGSPGSKSCNGLKRVNVGHSCNSCNLETGAPGVRQRAVHPLQRAVTVRYRERLPSVTESG